MNDYGYLYRKRKVERNRGAVWIKNAGAELGNKIKRVTEHCHELQHKKVGESIPSWNKSKSSINWRKTQQLFGSFANCYRRVVTDPTVVFFLTGDCATASDRNVSRRLKMMKRITSCLFQLVQSAYRQVQQLGLIREYCTSVQFKQSIEKLIHLIIQPKQCSRTREPTAHLLEQWNNSATAGSPSIIFRIIR